MIIETTNDINELYLISNNHKFIICHCYLELEKDYKFILIYIILLYFLLYVLHIILIFLY